MGTPQKEAELAFNEFVGARLREERTRLGLRIFEAANFAGVTASQYAYMEKGQHRATAYRLHVLAKVFGVTTDSLMPEPLPPDWLLEHIAAEGG